MKTVWLVTLQDYRGSETVAFPSEDAALKWLGEHITEETTATLREVKFIPHD